MHARPTLLSAGSRTRITLLVGRDLKKGPSGDAQKRPDIFGSLGIVVTPYILQWLMADIYVRHTLFRHAYTGLFLPHRSRERLSFLLAFICNNTHLYVTCLIHIRDMTHS